MIAALYLMGMAALFAIAAFVADTIEKHRGQP